MKRKIIALILVVLTIAILIVVINSPIRKSVKALFGFMDEETKKNNEDRTSHKREELSSMVENFNTFVDELEKAIWEGDNKAISIKLNYSLVNKRYFDGRLSDKYFIVFEDNMVMLKTISQGNEIILSERKINSESYPDSLYIEFNNKRFNNDLNLSNFEIDRKKKCYNKKDIRWKIEDVKGKVEESIEVEKIKLRECREVDLEIYKEKTLRENNIASLLEKIRGFISDKRIKVLVVRAKWLSNIYKTEDGFELNFSLNEKESEVKTLKTDEEIVVSNKNKAEEGDVLILLRNCSMGNKIAVGFENEKGIKDINKKFSKKDDYEIYEERCSPSLEKINEGIDCFSALITKKNFDYALVKFSIENDETLQIDENKNYFTLTSLSRIFPQYSKPIPTQIEFKRLDNQGHRINENKISLEGPKIVKISKYYQEHNPGCIKEGKGKLYITSIYEHKLLGSKCRYLNEEKPKCEGGEDFVQGIIKTIEEGGKYSISTEKLFKAIEKLEYSTHNYKTRLEISFKGENSMDFDIEKVVVIPPKAVSGDNIILVKREGNYIELKDKDSLSPREIIAFNGYTTVGINPVDSPTVLLEVKNEREEKTLTLNFNT